MSRICIQATWDDAPHLTQAQKDDLFKSLPAHQRNARTKGIPQLGSGVIYPVEEEEILCEPFKIPIWYRHVYGLDIGWRRTAAIWGCIDPEEDVLYLYSEHYQGQGTPADHAKAIRSRGKWIPGVIDPASKISSQKDGEVLLTVYQDSDLGLNLTPAINAVEAGILKVQQRLMSGRLRVFRTLQAWRSEFRIYRRDESGKVVKENDHLMDATRYLVMSGLLVAAQQPEERWGEMVSTPRHQWEYDATQSR